jgi:pyridinium-3,5-biscarboxylic acid mononucleotide sulfurtransferase
MLNNMEDMLEKKFDRLKEILLQMESVAVAFSGGVDSSFLLAAAAGVKDIDVIALTARSPFVPEPEIKKSKKTAAVIGIKHKIIRYNPLSDPLLKKNPPERCYICKKSLFVKFLNLAHEYGFRHLADGTNLDDLKAYRPGLKALQELGVRSPLAEAEFTKKEIRHFSREINLATWDEPSYSCLATGIPCGEELTESKLKTIELAEGFIRSLGFRQVRVRYHYPLARIEVDPQDIPRIIEPGLRKKAVERLKSLDFKYITIDMEGYRPGSMDGRKT